MAAMAADSVVVMTVAAVVTVDVVLREIGDVKSARKLKKVISSPKTYTRIC